MFCFLAPLKWPGRVSCERKRAHDAIYVIAIILNENYIHAPMFLANNWLISLTPTSATSTFCFAHAIVVPHQRSIVSQRWCCVGSNRHLSRSSSTLAMLHVPSALAQWVCVRVCMVMICASFLYNFSNFVISYMLRSAVFLFSFKFGCLETHTRGALHARTHHDTIQWITRTHAREKRKSMTTACVKHTHIGISFLGVFGGYLRCCRRLDSLLLCQYL